MTTTTFNQTIATNYTQRISKPSILDRFMSWCNGQQSNRFLWLGIALTGHAAILTPFTVMAVLFSGANLVLFGFAIGAMAMTLVPNLAALPTRITIPVFILSILIDLAIIVTCAFIGFNPAKVF